MNERGLLKRVFEEAVFTKNYDIFKQIIDTVGYIPVDFSKCHEPRILEVCINNSAVQSYADIAKEAITNKNTAICSILAKKGYIFNDTNLFEILSSRNTINLKIALSTIKLPYTVSIKLFTNMARYYPEKDLIRCIYILRAHHATIQVNSHIICILLFDNKFDVVSTFFHKYLTKEIFNDVIEFYVNDGLIQFLCEETTYIFSDRVIAKYHQQILGSLTYYRRLSTEQRSQYYGKYPQYMAIISNESIPKKKTWLDKPMVVYYDITIVAIEN